MLKTDFKNIAIISAIILVIGVYLVATTVVISKDGTFYISYSKQFDSLSFIDSIKNIPLAPGYPFLIYAAHKICDLFYGSQSLQSWIVSAQLVALFSKLISSIMLYFIGKNLFDSKTAFWSVLILSFLPDSAEFGSDALTEWPHLAFLFTGILLLLLGTIRKKYWLFGLAGISAGLAYLMRSEGIQIMIYGIAWLFLNILNPEKKLKRSQAMIALILMIIGFSILSFPYMKLKGYAFPDQNLIKFSAESNANADSSINYSCASLSVSLAKTKGNKDIVKNICETLVYYFVPFFAVGIWFCSRKLKSFEQNFYVTAFIILNIAMLLAQQFCFHFISRRHTFALVAFTIFYIPLGLRIISQWLTVKFKIDNRLLFIILIFIGFIICASKLYKSNTTQRIGFLDLSNWLKNNTLKSDIIAVPDPRISFYAERTGMTYDDNRDIQLSTVDYVVKTTKDSNEVSNAGLEEIYSAEINKHKKGKLVVYKVVR